MPALLLCVVTILSVATFLGMFSESVEECSVQLAQGCSQERFLRWWAWVPVFSGAGRLDRMQSWLLQWVLRALP